MILHCHIDTFYASIEERDRPELAGKPVIVGSPLQDWGVVSAANYLARRFGVYSALPTAVARRLCPKGNFLPPRIKYYCEVAAQVREIFERFTPAVQPLSLDEAYLEVHGSGHLAGSPADVGRKIKQTIAKELRLTASVGVANTKLMAKIAGDLGKPDGFMVVEAGQTRALLDSLPVERLWGVGRQTSQNLRADGRAHRRAAPPLAHRYLPGPLRTRRRSPLGAGPRDRQPAGRHRAGGQGRRPRDHLRARHRQA